MSQTEACGTIDLATVRLAWRTAYEGPPVPQLLRGAVAERFPDNPLFHQHRASGSPGGAGVLYRYPRIQYRWDRGSGLVVGFGEGAQAVLSLPWPSMRIRVGNETLEVLEATSTLKRHGVALTPQLIRYRFRAPWIPLNQENYARYRTLHPAEQARERDRLAVAGVLVALRGLGIEFPGRLYAAFHLRASHACVYKDQELLGLTGTLVANVDLPDGFALGRAVSHGYGWIERDHPPSHAEDSP